VSSLQLRSGGPSSQCALVGLSSARWNDKRNDMPATQPSAVGGARPSRCLGAAAPLGTPNRAPAVSSAKQRSTEGC
jgi:hypothetical protein